MSCRPSVFASIASASNPTPPSRQRLSRTASPGGAGGRRDRRGRARRPRPNSRPTSSHPPSPRTRSGRQRAPVTASEQSPADRRHRKSNGMKSGGPAVRDASPSSTGEAPTRARSRTATGRRNPSPRGATGPRSSRPDRRERRRDGPAQRRDDRPRAVVQSASPPAKGGIDPNSPFAALHSLKLALEKPGQD